MSSSTRTGGRNATSAVVPGRGVLSIGKPSTTTPRGYAWTALADVARLESGHTPSRPRDDYWNGGIPWIGIRDATGHNGEIISGTLQNISELGLSNSSTRLLPAGTVCLSRTASVGYVVQIDRPMCTSQDFVNWVCGPQLNPSYLRYALLDEADSIRLWATGSTHQTLYYPEAKALHVLMPARIVQDAVAEVLGALDDKIAANRRVIAAAGRLVESLVVSRLDQRRPLWGSIDFVFGEAFKGSEFSEPGLGRPLIRIRDLKSQRCQVWTTESRARERVVVPGEILVGMDAEFRATRWSGPQGVLNQRVLLAQSDKFGPAIVRHALAAPLAQIERSKTGTTVIHLNKSDLMSVEVSLPADDNVMELRSIADPMWLRMVACERENETLAKTRDELLPLLMSGKITVRDAEKRVEGVV